MISFKGNSKDVSNFLLEKKNCLTPRVKKGDMNEPRSHPNERNPRDMKVWLRMG